VKLFTKTISKKLKFCSQLIVWSEVLLEKLRLAHLLGNFSHFCRTRRFIATLARACHWIAFRTRLIQYPHSHIISVRSSCNQYSLFCKNRKRLMRLPCCLYIHLYLSVYPALIFAMRFSRSHCRLRVSLHFFNFLYDPCPITGK
jgi:hypothetical protein